ncbi:MAG: hypothetical protein WBA88_23995, partial [Pseudaminobacter sp.]
MKKLFALLLLAGCVSDAGNYRAMQGFVGMPIGRVIMHNGQPESRVRIAPDRVAYTFHMRNQAVYGNTNFISTSTVDCRFVFIVAAAGQHSDMSKV